MNKEIIEKKLHAWFSQMTEKYVWLRIKFEFNEVRGVFMVSFSPIYQIEQSDEFNLDAMNFADEMNDEYGNEAPLFTDEEALFRLSDEAEVISAHSFVSSGKPSTTLVTVQPQRVYASWASAANTTTAPAGKNFRPTQPATYAIVA
jgi:hypothetical protein